DQLRAAHHSAQHFAATRIVTQEFQEITRDAIKNQKSCEHLSVKSLSLEQPHENEKVRELNRGFEQLGRLQRNVKRRTRDRICQRICKCHSPEMMRFFSKATASREATDPANRVSQRQSGRERVTGPECGHMMLANVPGGRDQRG